MRCKGRWTIYIYIYIYITKKTKDLQWNTRVSRKEDLGVTMLNKWFVTKETQGFVTENQWFVKDIPRFIKEKDGFAKGS